MNLDIVDVAEDFDRESATVNLSEEKKQAVLDSRRMEVLASLEKSLEIFTVLGEEVAKAQNALDTVRQDLKVAADGIRKRVEAVVVATAGAEVLALVSVEDTIETLAAGHQEMLEESDAVSPVAHTEAVSIPHTEEYQAVRAKLSDESLDPDHIQPGVTIPHDLNKNTAKIARRITG